MKHEAFLCEAGALGHVLLDMSEVGLKEFLHDVVVNSLEYPLDIPAVVEVIHNREEDFFRIV